MISENIKQARVKKGLSQAKLASELNVKENTVWRWENGKATPNAKTIEKIASVLDIDPSVIFSKTNNNIFDNVSNNILISEGDKSTSNFAFWGSVVDKAKELVNTGNLQEIILIAPLMKTVSDMLLSYQKKADNEKGVPKMFFATGNNNYLENTGSIKAQALTVG